MTAEVRQICQRLSLRAPQQESLEILDRACGLLPLSKGADPEAALAAIQGEFPQVADFDRGFPSLCFALATGVGTRLLGKRNADYSCGPIFPGPRDRLGNSDASAVSSQ
jgi:type III restriction enzyme